MKGNRTVLLVLLVLLLGATASTARSESPIIISPSNWYTGLLENGASQTSDFTIQNGSSEDLVISNIHLKTTSSCFSIAPAIPLPATLAPLGEIQVKITFTAAGEGVHRASLEVDYIKVAR
jgi:hypothetical protein